MAQPNRHPIFDYFKKNDLENRTRSENRSQKTIVSAFTRLVKIAAALQTGSKITDNKLDSSGLSYDNQEMNVPQTK